MSDNIQNIVVKTIQKLVDSELSEYESLLLLKEHLKKESIQYEQAYLSQFGDLSIKLFKSKMDCVQLKKKIEFCNQYLNKGQPVDKNKLETFIKNEMVVFQAQLNKLKKETSFAKSGETITAIDVLEIKRIYQKLVKKLHPDINPVFAKSEKLKNIWMEIGIAYRYNDLKRLQELEVLTNQALSEENVTGVDFEIPNLQEKIAEIKKEIEEISTTKPYIYKEDLKNKKEISKKKKQMKEEIKSYEDYFNQLKEIWDKMNIKTSSTTKKGVKKWVVN